MRRAPRVLDGWTPRTYYEYDDDGRLVSSWTESEWTDVEVAWMHTLQAWRDEYLCPLCGGPKDVCQAPYGVYVYGTEAPARCMITDALDTSRHEWRDAQNPGALLHRPRVAPWGTPLDDGSGADGSSTPREILGPQRKRP